MRAIVISDTHGYYARLLELIGGLGDYDLLIHLGDGYRDLKLIGSHINADIVCVGGNNDFSSDNLPGNRIVEIGGAKIYCCHGHKCGVRDGLTGLAAEAKANGCDYALYGHTHIVADDNVGGVRCMNPGSIGYPINGRAAIEIVDAGGKAEFNFIYL